MHSRHKHARPFDRPAPALLGLPLVAAALLGAAAHAQVRPDAGSTQRDLEQRVPEVPRARSPLPSAPARPALRADDAQTFKVTALKLTGNSAFSAEVLLALVKDELVGRTVTLAQLQAAAAKITEYYRARGYLVARAYIPQQRIDAAGAEIEIAVLEGVLGWVSTRNRSRLSDAIVAGFTAPLASGALLRTETFERPILLLTDQAGAGTVTPVLKAGEGAGSSDLDLDIGPAPLASGQVELDNHGSRFTGEWRTTGQLQVASPFGRGESFSARVIETFGGLSSAMLRMAMPLRGDGWKAGLSYGDTRYRLGRDFAALQASGRAQSTGAFVSYAWVRSQRWNLNASLGADSRRLDDRIGSTGSDTPKKIDSVNVTLGGDVREPFTARSYLAWNVTALGGKLAINEAGARAADAASAMTQGDYRKLTFSLLYVQGLGDALTLHGSLLGQFAGKNLDSSEKFALGGPQGVRAYPVGEAAGDEGALVSLELRYGLPAWQGATPSVVLFTDQGRTRINRNPFAAGNNSRSLGAAGVGFMLAKSDDYALRVYWAGKTGGGAATADSDRSSRVWLQAVKYF